MIERDGDGNIRIDGEDISPADLRALARFFEILDSWDREAANDNREAEDGQPPRTER